MSYEFSLDFSAIINAFGAFINAVANGIASVLPAIVPFLVGIGVIGLMVSLLSRVPIIGDAISNIINTIRGLI